MRLGWKGLAGKKHSSLRTFVSYRRKNFMTSAPDRHGARHGALLPPKTRRLRRVGASGALASKYFRRVVAHLRRHRFRRFRRYNVAAEPVVELSFFCNRQF